MYVDNDFGHDDGCALCATVAHAQTRYNGFSVVLLLGETQRTAAGDGLPPAPGVRKALADVKDFLPDKSTRRSTRSGCGAARRA